MSGRPAEWKSLRPPPSCGAPLPPGPETRTLGVMVYRRYTILTSFYGSSCANNGKGALNTPG
eukprot:419016-Pyramimonas_sp.AAC.1